MSKKLKIKNLNRFGIKLLLASSIVPMSMFGLRSISLLGSTNYAKVNSSLNKFDDKKENNMGLKKTKDYKLFEDKIKKMSLEEVANLLHIDLYKEKDGDIIAFANLKLMSKEDVYYDLKRNMGDHFADIYHMITNIDKMKGDEIVKVLQKVENLPLIIKDINTNFDHEEIEIIKKVIKEKKISENNEEMKKLQKYILIMMQISTALSEAFIDIYTPGNEPRLPLSDILQSIAFDAFDN